MSRVRLGVALAVVLAVPAAAQTSPAPDVAGSARPARGPEQSSLGSPPQAGTTTTTGNTNPNPAVQQLNADERKKIETEGK